MKTFIASLLLLPISMSYAGPVPEMVCKVSKYSNIKGPYGRIQEIALEKKETQISGLYKAEITNNDGRIIAYWNEDGIVSFSLCNYNCSDWERSSVNPEKGTKSIRMGLGERNYDHGPYADCVLKY